MNDRNGLISTFRPGQGDSISKEALKEHFQTFNLYFKVISYKPELKLGKTYHTCSCFPGFVGWTIMCPVFTKILCKILVYDMSQNHCLILVISDERHTFRTYTLSGFIGTKACCGS